MAKGMPNMMALLGLIAVAGYKNRDKISDMLSDATAGMGGQASTPQGQIGNAQASGGGLLGELGNMFGGATAGGTVATGMGELMEQFRNGGQSQTADSWVGTGSNEPVQPETLQHTLGEDTIAELSAKTGLSREDLLARLSVALPDAVNRFTPDGRLPTAAEAGRYS